MLTKSAFIWLNSKCSNIVKCYYFLKELILKTYSCNTFSASPVNIQSLVSHDPSEIILICCSNISTLILKTVVLLNICGIEDSLMKFKIASFI